MPTTKPLKGVYATVTIGSGGTAVADISVPTLETWNVSRIAVQTTTNNSEPVAQVYIDSESPGNFLAGTYTGSNDSSDEQQMLMPGQHILCRWTGGDPGAKATLSVFGMMTS